MKFAGKVLMYMFSSIFSTSDDFIAISTSFFGFGMKIG